MKLFAVVASNGPNQKKSCQKYQHLPRLQILSRKDKKIIRRLKLDCRDRDYIDRKVETAVKKKNFSQNREEKSHI